jgi:hypothetical protein
LTRRTPIPQKSARQKQIDRLHALLKIACLKRDKYQCVMCGRPVTKYPLSDFDRFDVSHIFAKSAWPLVRFNLLNVKILCRKDHDWWGAHPNEADDWIQRYLGPHKYAQLIAAVTNPDPMFKNLSKVETYLKSEIRKYS